MDAEQIIRNLRYTQKKHEHDTLLTLQTDISAMARDSADCIETLQVQLAEKEKERQRWQDDFNQLNEGVLKRIAELEAQLDESQREKQAAVEQIEQQMIFDAQKGCEPCEICSNADKTPCEECNPKWRGLQAGKGKAK